MYLHPDEKLTLALRRLLVHRIRELGWPVNEAAESAELEDRSSRSHRIGPRTPRRLVERMLRLRRRRKVAWEIAAEIDFPVSTVSRYLRAAGLGRFWRIEDAEALSRPLRSRRSF